MKDDTLRLRLSKSEVEELYRQGKVSTTTRFGACPESFLRYSLLKDEEAERVKTSFAGHEIIVFVPGKLAAEWAETELVGFEESIPLNGNDKLYVLVEKDFPCLHQEPKEGNPDV